MIDYGTCPVPMPPGRERIGHLECSECGVMKPCGVWWLVKWWPCPPVGWLTLDGSWMCGWECALQRCEQSVGVGS